MLSAFACPLRDVIAESATVANTMHFSLTMLFLALLYISTFRRVPAIAEHRSRYLCGLENTL